MRLGELCKDYERVNGYEANKRILRDRILNKYQGTPLVKEIEGDLEIDDSICQKLYAPEYVSLREYAKLVKRDVRTIDLYYNRGSLFKSKKICRPTNSYYKREVKCLDSAERYYLETFAYIETAFSSFCNRLYNKQYLEQIMELSQNNSDYGLEATLREVIIKGLKQIKVDKEEGDV